MSGSTPDKTLLVISFGTSNAQARKSAIESCENSLAKAFPGFSIARAISSHQLRKTSAGFGDYPVQSIQEALEQLASLAVPNVLIQPLHIIPGFEYEKVLRAAEEFSGRFEHLSVSKPLLADTTDYNEAALAFLPLHQALEENEAIVLMGHGTQHPSNLTYRELRQAFLQNHMEKVWLATVEGQPKIEDIIPQLKLHKIRKVKLRPLMLVAGEHAHNDMAGDTPDSWKSVLKDSGFKVQVELTGLGEMEAIHKIYIRHARAAQEALRNG